MRLMFIYTPNGYRMHRWTPEGSGRNFTFGPLLAPLEDLRSDVLVVTGLANQPANADAAGGDHALGTGAYLTCDAIGLDPLTNGVSVDQIAAQHLSGQVPLPSLEIGAQGDSGPGSCTIGYPCALNNNISWAGAAGPRPKLVQPSVVFERLFEGTDPRWTEAEQARRREYHGSVLDVVREQANEMQSKLGRDDRYRLDEYLSGIRALERRIQPVAACETDVGEVGASGASERVDTFLDLAALAFQCDRTRVCTFMLANSGSNLVYDFIDHVWSTHHEVSHHGGDEESLFQLDLIEAWQVERIGRFVRKLRSISDGVGGNLLDHTIVVASSEVSDGNDHTHDNLPVLIAGKGGGAVKTGRHLVLPETPIANLYTSLLQAVGVDNKRFGADGTGPLDGLSG